VYVDSAGPANVPLIDSSPWRFAFTGAPFANPCRESTRAAFVSTGGTIALVQDSVKQNLALVF
jgi:hypothetical protein